MHIIQLEHNNIFMLFHKSAGVFQIMTLGLFMIHLFTLNSFMILLLKSLCFDKHADYFVFWQHKTIIILVTSFACLFFLNIHSWEASISFLHEFYSVWQLIKNVKCSPSSVLFPLLCFSTAIILTIWLISHSLMWCVYYVLFVSLN